MGHVIVRARVTGKRSAHVDFLVDTGATFSVVPSDLAARLGLVTLRRRALVTLGDGRRKRVRLGTLHLRLAGREAPVTALVGPRGIEPLLGSRTLEVLGLMVDPKAGRLRPTRSHSVLLVGHTINRR